MENVTGRGNPYKWAKIYYKQAFGSEMEKIAFQKMIELTFENKYQKIIKELYPSPPENILRKLAFKRFIELSYFIPRAIAGSHFLGRDMSCSIESAAARRNNWYDFLVSIPGTKEENSALESLECRREIANNMYLKGYEGSYIVSFH